MQVHFSNIQWSTNGRKVEGLPTEITIEVGEGVNVGLEGADELSGRFGWAVDGFSFEALQASV